MSHPVRRNFAHLSPGDQQAYIQAVLQADLATFSDGVSYWDKQDQIHQATHNHGGNSFIPWHREFVNRYEALLQKSSPDVALHYWDWTEDPTAASDGAGGTVDLSDSTLFGTFAGQMNGALAALHNGGTLAGSRDDTGDPADPPQSVTRSKSPGAPAVSSDATIVASSNGQPQASQWTAFRLALEGAHNTVHGYIGGDIGGAHQAFEDPFVFLLHSNVDRLFAMWQTQTGQEWRLDPSQVYGDQSNTSNEGDILAPLQPWDGTVSSGAPIPPWTGGSSDIVVKNCRDASVVRPPCYDTLPLTVTQVAPTPPSAIEFVNVVEFLPTARALRLRVHGCQQVTANASVTAPFTLLSATVTSPEPDGFEANDLLVWVLYSPGAAGSTDSGTLTVTVPETGDTFVVTINATVIANPDVGTSLVLDTSGSMSMASGVTGKDRMAVLHDAAPLFVNLLNDTDGVGVVRFDTDATAVAPVQDAGPTIGGLGRSAATSAISSTLTNLAGLTAIGDGLEAAAAQLTAVAGSYASTATILFTDGHETAEKTIAMAASSVNSTVFAIGLGTADQLNPGALSDIANGTNGYVLLTGNPGPDDQILLQKYFAQVLAGATNASIVVDPSGLIPVGGKVTVPFALTEADIRADVIVLAEAAEAIKVELIAPDGSVVGAGSAGVEEIIDSTYRALRVRPTVAAPTAPSGQWEAVLSIDGRRLRSWLAKLRKRLLGQETPNGAATFERIELGIKVHGVPFTLTVQARSALALTVDLSQTSRKPGSSGHLVAHLTDSGIPLVGSASVSAEVTPPGGGTYTVPMALDGEQYVAEIGTTVSGVYRVRIVASGGDLRGQPFTREELRTLAVWARGDDAPPVVIDPGGHGRNCELLKCLLHHDDIRAWLKRHEINPETVEKCLDKICA
jgi:hypothetical protein